MNELNWFEEGKQAAQDFIEMILESADHKEFDCPWPIYTSEGIAWFKGWNSVAKLSNDLDRRPINSGTLFEPTTH